MSAPDWSTISIFQRFQVFPLFKLRIINSTRMEDMWSLKKYFSYSDQMVYISLCMHCPVFCYVTLAVCQHCQCALAVPEYCRLAILYAEARRCSEQCCCNYGRIRSKLYILGRQQLNDSTYVGDQ